MDLISRTAELYLLKVAGQYPVLTVTGPRQSGKTTLCRKIFPEKRYVNLENLDTRQEFPWIPLRCIQATEVFVQICRDVARMK